MCAEVWVLLCLLEVCVESFLGPGVFAVGVCRDLGPPVIAVGVCRDVGHPVFAGECGAV